MHYMESENQLSVSVKSDADTKTIDPFVGHVSENSDRPANIKEEISRTLEEAKQAHELFLKTNPDISGRSLIIPPDLAAAGQTTSDFQAYDLMNHLKKSSAFLSECCKALIEERELTSSLKRLCKYVSGRLASDDGVTYYPENNRKNTRHEQSVLATESYQFSQTDRASQTQTDIDSQSQQELENLSAFKIQMALVKSRQAKYIKRIKQTNALKEAERQSTAKLAAEQCENIVRETELKYLAAKRAAEESAASRVEWQRRFLEKDDGTARQTFVDVSSSCFLSRRKRNEWARMAEEQISTLEDLLRDGKIQLQILENEIATLQHLHLTTADSHRQMAETLKFIGSGGESSLRRKIELLENCVEVLTEKNQTLVVNIEIAKIERLEMVELSEKRERRSKKERDELESELHSLRLVLSTNKRKEEDYEQFQNVCAVAAEQLKIAHKEELISLKNECQHTRATVAALNASLAAYQDEITRLHMARELEEQQVITKAIKRSRSCGIEEIGNGSQINADKKQCFETIFSETDSSNEQKTFQHDNLIEMTEMQETVGFDDDMSNRYDWESPGMQDMSPGVIIKDTVLERWTPLSGRNAAAPTETAAEAVVSLFKTTLSVIAVRNLPHEVQFDEQAIFVDLDGEKQKAEVAKRDGSNQENEEGKGGTICFSFLCTNKSVVGITIVRKEKESDGIIGLLKLPVSAILPARGTPASKEFDIWHKDWYALQDWSAAPVLSPNGAGAIQVLAFLEPFDSSTLERNRKLFQNKYPETVPDSGRDLNRFKELSKSEMIFSERAMYRLADVYNPPRTSEILEGMRISRTQADSDETNSVTLNGSANKRAWIVPPLRLNAMR